MSAPDPYISFESLRALTPTLRRDLDRLARELLEVKEEIKDYMDPMKEILDPLEKKKEDLQKQINALASKLPATSRRILAPDSGWKMYYRKGRTEISESRLLEKGVDIGDILWAKVEKGGTFIIVSNESAPEEGE